MLNLNTDITKISRVGATTAKRLKKLGLETVRDLLLYFPFRYDDFSAVTSIDNLEPGQNANVVGTIELIQAKKSLRKKISITEALVSDESETLKVIWFNQPYIAKNLRIGDKVSLAGKVEEDYGMIVMKSPAYEKVNLAPILSLARGEGNIHTQGLVSNYHLTANITHKQVRFLIKQVIGLSDKIIDWLPVEIIKNLKLLNLGEAIRKIHFPQNQKDINEARKRLAFNELFLLQLQSQIIKKDLKNSRAGKIRFLKKETKDFVDSLPFKLTNAQRSVAWDILRDMEKDRPMARLLEGDVGSGKTVVACIAMLNAALNGQQAVLMVPTEILAKQHYESAKKLFGDSLSICLLTRSQFSIFNFKFLKNFQNQNFKISKKDVLNYIKNGEAKIIIGTHALIQEKVEFKDLGLVIIDEQHRFGVEQRKTLIEKSGNKKTTPHLLSMTATPIPRSLALALYGDLDISIINQMPLGRKKIITKVAGEENRGKAYAFIQEEIKKGRQAFVICPLIDISDKLGVKSVKEEFEKLDKTIFHDLKIGMLHGRLKAKEKEEVMRDFLDNKIKILVSTSVVEVGVDIPNATIMMIEGADRFGLAQLHQFRGRVGRSDYQSYCFLFSESRVPRTQERLGAMVNNHDGLSLAKIDLEFRGPGEVYGTMQKGFPELRIASLFDYELMKLAKDSAETFLEKDLGLQSAPLLKEKTKEWEKKAHLE